MKKGVCTVNNPMKAYNITILDDDTVDINMYGEVVEKHPVDWWTGEKINGNYIALDDFLEDLKEIEGKQDINIHINSVGGDFYAGLAIYNRLKSLKGNITTINDGLAASAASIIFQAGNTRKMHAGSNLMLHGVSGFLFDYYNVEQLKAIIKRFTAHNNAAIGVYAERSGKTKEECKNLLVGETWLTGEEAVNAGLADEVVESSLPVEMSLTSDARFVISNGVPLPTNQMVYIPPNIPIMQKETSVPRVQQYKNNQIKTGGEQSMNIKTVEELKAAFPTLVAQMEQDAMEQGKMAERERLQGIELIENSIADKEMLKNAKYGNTPLTAEQLAFHMMREEAKIKEAALKSLKDSGRDTEGVEAVPNHGNNNPQNEENDTIDFVNRTLATVNQALSTKKQNG